MSQQAVEERRGWASDIVWVDTERVDQPADAFAISWARTLCVSIPRQSSKPPW